MEKVFIIDFSYREVDQQIQKINDYINKRSNGKIKTISAARSKERSAKWLVVADDGSDTTLL
jgi:hypothetical protein